jgi:hypothetical protein
MIMKQFSAYSVTAAILLASLIVLLPETTTAAEWKMTGEDSGTTVPRTTPDISQTNNYETAAPVETGTSTYATSMNGDDGDADSAGEMDEAPTSTRRSWRIRDTALTVSVWETDGGTSWNHSARSLNTVFGDPTSKLEYRDISGTVIDLGLEVPLASGFYMDFHYAHSSVDDGILIDDDFLSPEGAAFLGIGTTNDLLLSRTVSAVQEGTIQSFSGTIGREVLRFVDSPGNLRVYARYQDYQESYHAYGVRQVTCAAPFVLCAPEGSQEFTGQRVISNKANWRSVYIGVDGRFNITPRLSVRGDLAYSPWARVTNNDVHLLRGDLRSDPSIRIQTTGTGVNAMAEVAYRLGNWEASLGYQYWKLESRGDPNAISFFPADEIVGVDANLNEIVTKREGWRVGLSYLFGNNDVY